ncbi:hypothetical protein ElyMa_003645300 [Elysia marginata]|uniref:Uncharacterized protein n=1 Tax=Elysia marginata TaxID=1093978 RepID=A0AAV4EW55_9GAST|nr:hypothetical protein ElyMa_003645300 [Elysia marginata]
MCMDWVSSSAKQEHQCHGNSASSSRENRRKINVRQTINHIMENITKDSTMPMQEIAHECMERYKRRSVECVDVLRDSNQWTYDADRSQVTGITEAINPNISVSIHY